MTETPQAINIISKSQLARLLAKEDIKVTVGNYQTAFFDIKNRELGIPNWNFTNKGVLDLLIGHEVGHALYTPEDAIDLFKTRFPNAPFDICNIIEDIRIEKMIQNTYPGLVHSFKKGYEHFIDEDLFQIKDKDVSELSFADRLNVRAKTRNETLVPLDAEEELFYEKCLNAETYDEVLDLCEELIEKTKDENKDSSGDSEEEPQLGSEEDETPGNTSESPSNETEETEDGEEDDSSENDSSKIDGNSDGDATENLKPSPSLEYNQDLDKDLEDLVSETMKALEDGLVENQTDSSNEIIIKTPSSEEFLECVVPIKTVREARYNARNYSPTYLESSPDQLSDWLEYKSETKKAVSVLLKEFERRKAAFQYSRASEARSGSINVNKLHAYKYDDKIFKTVTMLADAKSHGMVFFIDYSGSMCYSLRDVIKQTIMLANFCYAANIPFEVYGFTSPSYMLEIPQVNDSNTIGTKLRLKDSLSLIELLNSKLKRRDFEIACKELYTQSLYSGNTFGSPYEGLGSTPLTEALLAAHHVVKKFKKNNSIQKTTIMVLSDGDGQPISVRESEVDGDYSNSKSAWGAKKFINVNGEIIDVSNFQNAYPHLIESLKKAGNTVIGFYIFSGRKSNYKYHLNRSLYSTKTKIENIDEHIEKLINSSKKRKEKFVTIEGGFNYDNYYVFNNTSFKESRDANFNDDDFEVGDLNSARDRNKVLTKFKKQGVNKKNQRTFLTKFAEVIS